MTLFLDVNYYKMTVKIVALKGTLKRLHLKNLVLDTVMKIYTLPDQTPPHPLHHCPPGSMLPDIHWFPLAPSSPASGTYNQLEKQTNWLLSTLHIADFINYRTKT